MTGPEKPDLLSPRLRALRDAVAAHDPDVLAAFWAEVRDQGAPLIEPWPERDDCCLVTFLWEETEPLENATLMAWFLPGDPADHRLAKLPDTNVWFKSVPMRADLHTDYAYLLNDSGIPLREDPDVKARLNRAVPDPLNPLRVFEEGLQPAADAYLRETSRLQLPQAAPLRWRRRQDVPHGAVTEQRFASARLGNERAIWVYTPPGYAATDTPAHLLVQTDGDECVAAMDLPHVLDNLHAAGAIPPTVAVFVDNVDRGAELPCNPAFADMVADELIPWMRARYRIAPSKDAVIMAGQSYGGLAATWAGLTRPDAIGNVIGHSSSFWWSPAAGRDDDKLPLGVVSEREWLIHHVARMNRVPTRFYLAAGALETESDRHEASLVNGNRFMHDVMLAKGYDVTYREFPGAHDWFIWGEELGPALIHLLG
ncbi:MAG: alpha/beta hydrolase-fold protein [Thermomicrobiales bacterium]